MEGYVLTVERTIDAAPAAVFDLLADPARHPEIDGSGTVKEAHDTSGRRLVLGDVFGMSMKLGIAYSMANTVVEFEENRRIAWQARPRGFIGRVAAGRIWRYELEEVDGKTRVKESWDLTQDKQRFLLRLGPVPRTTKENMERTLARIDELVGKGPSSEKA